MASFFNMKGTTQGSFQVGINGPILTKINNNTILLPDNVVAPIKIIFGSNSDALTHYITSTDYTGNAATATKLQNSINILFNGITGTAYEGNDSSAKSIDRNSNITLDINEIPASLLTGNIIYDRISSLIGTAANTIAAGNHNHDSVYILKSNTFDDATASNLDISGTYNQLVLTYKDNSIETTKIQKKAITSDKIADHTLADINFDSDHTYGISISGSSA